MSPKVRLEHAAIDEAPNGDIIFRGALVPDTIRHILLDEYQREILSNTSIQKLVEALTHGGVPDIILGMRGQDYSNRGGIITLNDPTYVIDGLQRKTAALRLIQEGGTPHLGAVVHFGTTQEWERALFQHLNQDRIKLSPSVLLRNFRWDHHGLSALYDLATEDQKFVLYERVSWDQRMRRLELLTALTYCHLGVFIHSHLGGIARSNRVDEVAIALDRVVGKIGMRQFKANVVAFFDMIDQAFGISNVTYREGATHLKGTFLRSLALVVSMHENFWRDDSRLFVDAKMVAKIGQFPINDPTVKGLASASGQAGMLLRLMFIDHINSGKRVHRLIPRSVPATQLLADEPGVPE